MRQVERSTAMNSTIGGRLQMTDQARRTHPSIEANAQQRHPEWSHTSARLDGDDVSVWSQR
jgi:hypothetical protein